MKKITLLALFVIAATFQLNAQNDINFDPSSTDGSGWIGFMNVSETPANGGGAVFGSAWGVPDLIVVDNLDGTASLLPNRIGDPDTFWQGSVGVPEPNPTGNKIMEATYYLENDALAGTDFTFNAEIISNTLDATGILDYGFTYTAFIKVFAPDYSSNVTVDSDALTGGNFTLTHNASDSVVGEHIQYGFIVTGPNVRLNTPDNNYDADYAALGSILVGPNSTLSVSENSLSEFKVFPNPAQNNWTIRAASEITEIIVSDMLGKQVMMLQPQNTEVRINAETLPQGIYLAKISSGAGSKTIKLIRN